MKRSASVVAGQCGLLDKSRSIAVFVPKIRGHQVRCARNSTTTATSNPFLLKSRHGDFKKIETSRLPFDHSSPVVITQTPLPDWKYGAGTNNDTNQLQTHVEIDPYDVSQAMVSNYKLLISGIPRPISFVSTVSKDGQNKNLAPFSYFQVVDHDPPIVVIGFSARASRPKDTRRNLVETGECVISVVSEHMVEAVNGTSLDVEYNVSEWGLSGLRAAPSSTVKPERVENAVFSMEGKLLEMKELDYHGEHSKSGNPSGALAIIQVTRFWVRKDALSDRGDEVELEKLRPLVQLGGISYGRVRETFELPRPKLVDELANEKKGLQKFVPTTSKS